ncbi:MAG: hypothetical protein CNC89_03675 [Puniceicoccaceae bacterium MED-G31]|nr:MAG: hypothetical protein CNC89_03675 [Puniceicoccaceae bacterium MED-G31]
MTPLVIPDPLKNVGRFVSIDSASSLDARVDQAMSTFTDAIEVSLEDNESLIESSSSPEEVFEELGEVDDQDFCSLTLDESSDLITIDEANSRLSNAVLDSLLKNFNGKVSGVRNVDSKDRIF